jgi:hypothetical protein
MDDLQTQSGFPGNYIALGKHIPRFDLDQALRFLRTETEFASRINQKMLASEIGFGHHIQWIDFLFHPDGNAAWHGQQAFAPESGQWEDMYYRSQH